MRPLAEIPRQVLGNVRTVVFDVDDTLTTHGTLTGEAFAALWSLADAGLRLVPVTGRPLGWTDAMAASWPVTLAVGENGAGWSLRRGRALEVGYYHDEPSRRAQEERLAVIRRRVAEELPAVRLASDQPARRCDLAYDVGERERLDDASLERLSSLIEEHGARPLVSSVHAHAIAGDWDKARGVARAAHAALGVELEAPAELARWLFVGDSGNDAAAFELFSASVGVANVRDHLHRLPTPPRWVTEAERGAGFAELARAILEAHDG